MFEKADRKNKIKYQKLGELMITTLKTKDDPAKIAKMLVEYIESEGNKNG